MRSHYRNADPVEISQRGQRHRESDYLIADGHAACFGGNFPARWWCGFGRWLRHGFERLARGGVGWSPGRRVTVTLTARTALSRRLCGTKQADPCGSTRQAQSGVWHRLDVAGLIWQRSSAVPRSLSCRVPLRKTVACSVAQTALPGPRKVTIDRLEGQPQSEAELALVDTLARLRVGSGHHQELAVGEASLRLPEMRACW